MGKRSAGEPSKLKLASKIPAEENLTATEIATMIDRGVGVTGAAKEGTAEAVDTEGAMDTEMAVGMEEIRLRWETVDAVVVLGKLDSRFAFIICLRDLIGPNSKILSVKRAK